MDIVDFIKTQLTNDGIVFTERDSQAEAEIIAELPGVNKLKTTTRISVFPDRLRFEAFVCRNPDENFLGVYRFILKRNRKLYIVRYTIDDHGDIYLVGSLARSAFNAQEWDTIMGTIVQTADEDFNVLLELGFYTSIKKEWDWRISRGESTRNLEAFRHILDGQEP